MEKSGESTRVPLAEENLRVEKKQAFTGKVKVRTISDVSEQVVRATLQQEGIEVTRVPINVEVETPPEMRSEGDTLIVPVLEERLVVEKRLVLVEELHIRRRVSQEDVSASIPVRKQRAIVERTDEHGNPVATERP